MLAKAEATTFRAAFDFMGEPGAIKNAFSLLFCRPLNREGILTSETQLSWKSPSGRRLPADRRKKKERSNEQS